MARVRFSRALLAEVLHLPEGVWITDAQWHADSMSVEVMLEGEVPATSGEMLTPLIRHTDTYTWQWLPESA